MNVIEFPAVKFFQVKNSVTLYKMEILDGKFKFPAKLLVLSFQGYGITCLAWQH